MSDVTLDGEAVQFEGPLPSGALSVFNLLVEVLESDGRCLTSFRVDGKDWLSGPQFSEQEDHVFQQVEAVSSPLAEVLLRLIAQVRASTLRLSVRLKTYSAQLVSVPWPELITECGLLSRGFLPMAHLLGVLSAHDPLEPLSWQNDRKKLLVELEDLLHSYADCAEKPDPQALSKLIQADLLPWFHRYWKWIDDEVVPRCTQIHLEKQASLN